MKKSKQAIMWQQIARHGDNLKAVFNLDGDPILLCKKLRRLETTANRLATGYCNGTVTHDVYEQQSDKLLDKVDRILQFRNVGIPVFLNGDPRGYALKIDDEYMRSHDISLYRDWGGYGIIAPDFTP